SRSSRLMFTLAIAVILILAGQLLGDEGGKCLVLARLFDIVEILAFLGPELVKKSIRHRGGFAATLLELPVRASEIVVKPSAGTIRALMRLDPSSFLRSISPLPRLPLKLLPGLRLRLTVQLIEDPVADHIGIGVGHQFSDAAIHEGGLFALSPDSRRFGILPPLAVKLLAESFIR